MTSLTRGPLPARVYWTRRLLVLVVAVAMVASIGWLLGRGSDASDGTARATQVSAEGSGGDTAAESAAAGPEADAAAAKAEQAVKAKQQKRKKKTKPVLAEPEGPCANEDVKVTPKVDEAVAGRDVVVVIKLRSILSPACTWRLSPEEATLKITSGSDDIWSSRECPRVMPTQDVVLRNNTVTKVELTWNSRRSDEDCSPRTDWARPGWYHVTAAALAGEPMDRQFELETPIAPVITRTVTPEPKPQKSAAGKKKNREQAAN